MAKKNPAFLFYPNDYLGGTLGMSLEEKGAYIEVLMLQFNRGHMTTHMIGHAIGQTGGQTSGQIWEKIKDKFVQDENGLWYNTRLDIEKEKRIKYTESRNNNRKGKNQYTKKEENPGGHMTADMLGHTEGHIEDNARAHAHSSSSILDKIVNTGEVVNEEKKEKEKKELVVGGGVRAGIKKIGFQELENFAEQVIQDKMFTDTMAVNLGIQNTHLRAWLGKFNMHCVTDGKLEKDLNEYKKHFGYWIYKQEYTKPPPEKKQTGRHPSGLPTVNEVLAKQNRKQG